jgi:hypothetical protein
MPIQCIDNVISVCTIKDIRTWASAVNYITTFIKSKKYHLIVPERYLNEFRYVTPDQVLIHSEDSLAKEFSFESLESIIPISNHWRVGWYYQQLLKIQALLVFGKDLEENNLLWDADTIPLQKLEFISEEKLIYYTGNEYHEPYFETINRLLALEKKTDFSFIAQCFPVKHKWLLKFKDEIENRNKKKWFDAILNCSNLDHPTSFSEYETLGTYFASHYGPQMLVNKTYWERFGNKLCKLEDLSDYISEQGNKPVYMAFETWDPNKHESNTVDRKLINNWEEFSNSSRDWIILNSYENSIFEIQEKENEFTINENEHSINVHIESTAKCWSKLIKEDANSANKINSLILLSESNSYFEKRKDRVEDGCGQKKIDQINKSDYQQQVEIEFAVLIECSKGLNENTEMMSEIIEGIDGTFLKSWPLAAKKIKSKKRKKIFLKLKNLNLDRLSCLAFLNINWLNSPDIIEISVPALDIKNFLLQMNYGMFESNSGATIFYKK